MKTTLVRSLALVLVVAGFSASTVSSAAAKKTASAATVAPLGAIGGPTPLCPMHQPDGCGID